MNDPVAEAAAKLSTDAAPSSTKPAGIVGEMLSEFHKLEEKVEHLIHHQEAVPKVEAPGEIVAGSAAAAPADISATTSASNAALVATPVGGELGNSAAAIDPSDNATAASAESSAAADQNAVTGAAAQPVITSSALGASIPAGIPGIVETVVVEPSKLVSSISGAVLDRIAAIKKHLSIRGFEQSAVADIHAELDAIERLL